jgi:ParB family chromosome partitioning protein
MKGRVASIAKSFRLIGQLNPITVNSDGNKLIAGRTRWEAAKSLEWKDILCNVVDFDSLHAKLAEIDENIERENLNALEESQALAERKSIYLDLHPETANPNERGGPGRGNKTSDTLSPVSFVKDTAEKMGVSDRTVERAVAIGEAIEPAAAKALKDTDVADDKTQLSQLVKLDPEEQVRVAKAIKAGEAETVKEAIEATWKCQHCGGTERDEDGDCEKCREPEEVDDSPEAIMREKNSEIESFCRKLIAFAEKEWPQDKWLTHNGRGDAAMQKIKDACATLRTCKCSAVCPKCDGAGCRRCLDTGRVTRYMLEQLT